jgi:hypothetical protein
MFDYPARMCVLAHVRACTMCVLYTCCATQPPRSVLAKQRANKKEGLVEDDQGWCGASAAR